MARKIRLDNLLVARGLVESRSRAQALVMAGDVRVEGESALKPGMAVSEQVEVTIAKPPPFVGRGGIKLDHALNEFGIDVSDKVAADIGASTGGFTDCLLKRGASRV
jgi:23S rRNA (cytidine1920-2'-O)/16S rRNA (cytidine1409-2'-O)-methyltransferase